MGRTANSTETLAETASDTLDPAVLDGGQGDDSVTATDEPASELSPDDPAVTGIPRDERVDSIDRVTGTLTEEALELRRERAADEG